MSFIQELKELGEELFCHQCHEQLKRCQAEFVALKVENCFLLKENARLCRENWQLRLELDTCLSHDEYGGTYDCWDTDPSEL